MPEGLICRNCVPDWGPYCRPNGESNLCDLSAHISRFSFRIVNAVACDSDCCQQASVKSDVLRRSFWD